MQNIQNLIVTMAKGNPGAAMAMINLAQRDPELIDILNKNGIHGTDIYVLYSDICGRDSFKTAAVLRAINEGRFSAAILKDACSRQDYSGREMVPVEELCKA
jgi:hypothetical protein